MKEAKGEKWVLGIDCQDMGNKFAIVLLQTPQTKLCNFLPLKRHPLYKKLKNNNRLIVCNNIRIQAKIVLQRAGYPRETINTVVDNS